MQSPFLLLVDTVYAGIPLDFAVDDWWIWLLLGLQSAFYTYSMARLPQVLGYSVSFILVITGKMSTAAAVDTMGVFRPPLAISPWRCISVAATLLGAVFFTLDRAKNPRNDEACSNLCTPEEISTCEQGEQGSSPFGTVSQRLRRE
eukprot:Skav213479  [mRNA]  locus=scaffold565:144218:147547:+ [translate_table: standard]